MKFLIFPEALASSWSLWSFLHGAGREVPFSRLEKQAQIVHQLNALDLLKASSFRLFLLLDSPHFRIYVLKRYTTPKTVRSLIELAKQSHLAHTFLPLVKEWVAPLLSPERSEWTAFFGAGTDEEVSGPVVVLDEDPNIRSVSLIVIEFVKVREGIPSFLARSLALTALAAYQEEERKSGIGVNLFFTHAYQYCQKAIEEFFQNGYFDLSHLKDFYLFWDLRDKACQKYLINKDFSISQAGGSLSLKRLIVELDSLFPKIKPCPVCGEKVTFRQNQKYCSDTCRKRANRIVQRIRSRFTSRPSLQDVEKVLTDLAKFTKNGSVVRPYDIDFLLNEAFGEK